jgi:hypothetical protein
MQTVLPKASVPQRGSSAAEACMANTNANKKKIDCILAASIIEELLRLVGQFAR